MKLSDRISNIAVELQEHINLPIHGELRLKLFEIADEVSKLEYKIQEINEWVNL